MKFSVILKGIFWGRNEGEEREKKKHDSLLV